MNLVFLVSSSFGLLHSPHWLTSLLPIEVSPEPGEGNREREGKRIAYRPQDSQKENLSIPTNYLIHHQQLSSTKSVCLSLSSVSVVKLSPTTTTAREERKMLSWKSLLLWMEREHNGDGHHRPPKCWCPEPKSTEDTMAVYRHQQSSSSCSYYLSYFHSFPAVSPCFFNHHHHHQQHNKTSIDILPRRTPRRFITGWANVISVAYSKSTLMMKVWGLCQSRWSICPFLSFVKNITHTRKHATTHYSLAHYSLAHLQTS